MSTLYLRQFPGKRRFSKVNAEEFVLPSARARDRNGWGMIGQLEAGFDVRAPDGETLVRKRWPAKSYTRNMARIMRGLFGETVQLVDITAAVRNIPLRNADNLSMTQSLFIAQADRLADGNDYTGACMGVGDGVALEDHTRNEMVSKFQEYVQARQFVRTTVQSTVTLTLEITGAIGNGTAGSVNITEIALAYYGTDTTFFNSTRIGNIYLLAYDGITSTPVAAGGVIAPRYTLDFPV